MGDWPCLAVMTMKVESYRALGLELFDKLADGRVDELDFAEQRFRWRSSRIEVAAPGIVLLFSMSFWPTLTAWKFMPKMLGTLVFLRPR